MLGSASVAAQMPGDVDCDDAVSDDDFHALLPVLFDPDPHICRQADVNEDMRVDAADLTSLLQILRRVYLGPAITFFGLTAADGRRATPLGTLPNGTVVYYRGSGFGFQVVIEAKPGSSHAQVAMGVFEPNRGDPAGRPAMQAQVNRALGTPSGEVCDAESGVPGIDPPSFALTQSITNTLNDLGCRFMTTTASRFACTQDPLGRTAFIAADSRAQFCLAVGRVIAFPRDDTVMTVQLHDEHGNESARARLLVRVGTGPMPATFTPVPPTPTRTETATRTMTRAAGPTITRTPTVGTATRTPTGQPTLTTRTPTRGRTSTPLHVSPTATRRTTPTASGTPSRTPTHAPLPTATFGTARGPIIRFLGLAKADDLLVVPEPPLDPNDPNEIRVFRRPFGSGFSLVVEARPGSSGRPVGRSTFNPGGCPDLQVQATRNLGERPTQAVCDVRPPDAGGVPGIPIPQLEENAVTCDRFNDLGCRFVDGGGMTTARSCSSEQGCVRFSSGTFGCVAADATIQFCGFVAHSIAFPPGDTLITVRARDTQGALGPPQQMILRIDAD